jgi:hypothetical protein
MTFKEETNAFYSTIVNTCESFTNKCVNGNITGSEQIAYHQRLIAYVYMAAAQDIVALIKGWVQSTKLSNKELDLMYKALDIIFEKNAKDKLNQK